MHHHRRGIPQSNGNLKGAKPGLQSPRVSRNYGRKIENFSEVDFGSRAHKDEDSEISSPPLWKTSPPMSPTTKASIFQHLPPTSQAQAIAKGRQELMEMMKGVPESAYELSLKDLVELPSNKRDFASGATTQEEREIKKMTTTRRHEKRRNVKNGPFLLNMFFPAALIAKKKRGGTGTCSKVSPKPPSAAVDGEKVAFEKSLDGEWWKKSSSEAVEKKNSGRSRSTRTSSSTGRSR